MTEVMFSCRRTEDGGSLRRRVADVSVQLCAAWVVGVG